jgi:hypothetical protein
MWDDTLLRCSLRPKTSSKGNKKMSAVGNWTLHYSWGCTGGYGTSSITFNANGTLTMSPYTGKWIENSGEVVWKFDNAPNAVYSGNEMSNAMLGISTTFAGLNGCWYALRVGTSLAAEGKSEHDAAGVKAK